VVAEPDTQPAGDTLGEWFRFLGAMPEEGWIPVWPPDAFAFTAAFLRRTGAYVGFVNGVHPPGLTKAEPGRKPAAQVGREWRATLEKVLAEGKSDRRLSEACPDEITMWWRQLLDGCDKLLAECAKDDAIVAAAANLCVAADAASTDVGVSLARDPFIAMAESLLLRNKRRSFCLRVLPSKLAVLGKQHTPQRGCTIRSLTHNLSLYTPTEIQAFWHGPFPSPEGELDVFNLLLLPWPTEVHAGDFRAAGRNQDGSFVGDLTGVHRYFDYNPAGNDSAAAFAARVEVALDLATREADQIHGIVFPELSLTMAQYEEVEKIAVRRNALIVAGVRDTGSKASQNMPVNACVIQPIGLTTAREKASELEEQLDVLRRYQLKHHRWCLDRGQILQYGLGSRLPASRDCWERIFIGPRHINFVTLGSWLTTCVLICEDLARQDPVTEVIRAVGPNLVFALLMDGPQLRNRWPSRYASVLAEDPGCSVLSLTSLGMACRSRFGDLPSSTPEKTRTIGLWRDAIYGEREISLPEKHDACVLSLVCKTEQEFTIDGRGDNYNASFPVYAGIVPLDTTSRNPGR